MCFRAFFFNVAKVLLLLVVQEEVEKKGQNWGRPMLVNEIQLTSIQGSETFFLAEDDDDDDGSFVVSSKQLEAS